MCLSTVDENGLPKARSVNYAIGNDHGELFFITSRQSKKIKEIEHNHNVFVVIDHNCPAMGELHNLKYLRATGKAYIAKTPEENKQAFELVWERFPYLKNLPCNQHDFVGVKVKLSEVTVYDNTIQFGFTEQVIFPRSN